MRCGPLTDTASCAATRHPPNRAHGVRAGGTARHARTRCDAAAPDIRTNAAGAAPRRRQTRARSRQSRSEEHTSELQSLMRISYAVFCLKKKKHKHTNLRAQQNQKTPT